MIRTYLIIILILNLSVSVVLYAQKDAKIVKAQKLMEQEKYSEADVVFDEILNANPNRLDVLYDAAYCKLYTGRPDVTIDYIKRFLNKNKQSADAYNLLGFAYESSGINNDAIENYSKAIKLNKNFYLAYFNRGRAYLQIDSISLAKKDFNYAKKNKVINPELYFITGSLYAQLGQYDSAFIDLNKILKYKSDDPYYLSLLGDAYFMTANNNKSQLEKAIEYYTKSLRIDSHNVGVLKNRAFIYDMLEENEKGEADRNKILEIQKEKGFNPLSINYKRIAAGDKSFSIDLPELWKILVSKNDTLDVIFFFDTTFNYKQQNGFYTYDFGGRIYYYPNYFKTDLENFAESLQLRYLKFAEFVEQRKIECNTTLIKYSEIMRKIFNATEENARSVVKYTFFSEDNTKYFSLEYFYMTTTGKLIVVHLWMPEEDAFYYEPLFDYIYLSLEVNG